MEASCLFYIAGDKLALTLLTHYFRIFPGWKQTIPGQITRDAVLSVLTPVSTLLHTQDCRPGKLSASYGTESHF